MLVFFICRSKCTGLRNSGKRGSQLTYRKNRPLDMAAGTNLKKKKETCILEQKMEECWKNVECRLCHKNVDKGEEVQW